MCRHEPVPLLWMLVLSGRGPLRPAACCVHGSRAQVRQTARHQFSSRAGPEGSPPFGLFCVQGVLRMTTKLSAFLVVLLALAARPSPAAAPPVNGLWDATVLVHNGALEIPFRFELPGWRASVKGSFFNGDDKTTSTSGSLQNGKLTLNFDELGTKLEATLKDGQLDGEYSRGTRGAPYPFHAKRFTPTPSDGKGIPSIAGLWNVQVGKSSKGEAAWQLIV